MLVVIEPPGTVIVEDEVEPTVELPIAMLLYFGASGLLAAITETDESESTATVAATNNFSH